jgi:hypothetical protein
MEHGHWIILISICTGCAILAILARLVSAQDSTPPDLSSTITAPDAHAPLGVGFTYHGQLKKVTTPGDNTCDFQFSLWDSPSNPAGQIDGPVTKTGVNAVHGLFTIVDLDFGATAFDGNARWLSIAA